jgi:hypothetical protein
MFTLNHMPSTPMTQAEMERQVQFVGSLCKEALDRIEGERLTLEFAAKSPRRVDGGKRPITDAPLFGGPAQEDLF